MKTKLHALMVTSLAIILILSLISFSACSTSAPSTAAPTSQAPAAATTKAPAATTQAPAAPTTQAPANSSTPVRGGTLKFAHSFFPSANIGWIPDANWGGPVSYMFMEPLLKVDINGSISPWLATKWEVSPDLKTLTLTLRQGVKFHDGSDFNAAVAKWNIENLIAAKRADFVNIDSVEIVNDYAIKLNLKKFTNSLLTLMGDRYGFMVSKAAYDAHGGGKAAEDWMKLNPVGTGPFKLDKFSPGVSVKGVRFDNYWQQGLPYLDSIEGYGMTDPMTRSQSFLAGEMDLTAGDLSKVDYDLLKQGNFSISKYVLSMSIIIPDSANPDSPFSNIKVRQAIDYAVDRQAIVDSLGYGFWPVSNQFAIPGTASYIKDLTPRPYDPEKAKQLLKEAGFSSFDTEMLGNTMTTNKDYLTAVQGYLSKVGINAKISMLDNASYISAIQKGWKGFAAGGKSINANLNTSLSNHFSKNFPDNVSMLKTDDFMALWNASAAAATYDPALAQKMVRYLYDNALINTFFASTLGYIGKSNLHDLNLCNNISAMYLGTATAWKSK